MAKHSLKNVSASSILIGSKTIQAGGSIKFYNDVIVQTYNLDDINNSMILDNTGVNYQFANSLLEYQVDGVTTNSQLFYDLFATLVGYIPTFGSSEQLYLDFGAFPGSNIATVTINEESNIVNESIPYVEVIACEFDGKTVEEVLLCSSLMTVRCSPLTTGVGFIIYGFSTEKLQGKIPIRYGY